ncbi:MAG TPA: NADH-quinone oxidoreductase subunit NuoE [Clostridia bacterium]|nr:NADH-quinone oxidoreductase subunit NuoE [Clostridia bacterium]
MNQCCCNGLQVEIKEQDLRLQQVLQEYRGQTGALIPVLQSAQDIYGYLPKSALETIALELRLPLSKVYGVVTFYSQFHLEPRGRYIVRVCLGTACHVRGGTQIHQEVRDVLKLNDGQTTTEDLRFTVESVACIGACALGPVIMVNNDTYGRLKKESIAKILAQYE